MMSATSWKTLKFDNASIESLNGKFTLRSMKIARKLKIDDGELYGKKLINFIESKQFDEGFDGVEWAVYLVNEKERSKRRNYIRQKDIVGLKDFIFVKVIGTGASGDVLMSLKVDDDKFYAIKVLNKEILLRNNIVSFVRNEKAILNAVRCPFTIHMEYFFQTESNLYFVLPLVVGMDLFVLLRHKGCIPEDAARFYLAQILLAFEYLHNLQLVFRDLKPENIMMDANGYIKLTDFGYCKFVERRTYTVCGTPEYMAPELYQHKGYGRSVDWWAYGVLAYELCAGYTPFYAEDVPAVCLNVLKGIYMIPSCFSIDLVELLKRLLQTDVTKRYGNLKCGITTIKDHIWFKDIDWQSLIERTADPPYKPTLNNYQYLSKYDLVAERPTPFFLKQFQHIFAKF